ncbi:hypothetical protein F5879DRAFT_983609 [Lentinula edodes]|uniref:Uncharacterized protein n=1 Tax=Lentinula edodes TaxID=5353 RepID=A0A1Q3ET98_LENED|nr:hypothetical protein F5879DRAFT_983609 [Lentinula edodes]KAJ3922408.1 hypothetical protein F5877DRAFT_75302 [Lentinula edodes]GAW10425.1 hypothetical protein LENED_012687 [Lentinula edodes]
MSHYYNPIHPTVSSQNTSQYSSLGGAVRGAPAQSSFLIPNRRRVPQSIYQPTGKWRNQTGRLAPIHAPVSVDFKGYSRQGMRMMELYARGAFALSQMMEGGDDRVLAHTGLKRITLHIRWPGYENYEWIRSIELNTSSGPITRAEIAAIVAQNFHRYFEKLQYSSTPAMEWHIGPMGISFDKLVLVSISNVFEDAWQADVAVDI